MFEDVRREWSFIFLLSLTDEGILRQAGIADHEISEITNLALEQLHVQRIFREGVAVSLLE